MYNIHTEMPLGNRSRGYDRKDAEVAAKDFQRVVGQLEKWRNFICDVVLEEDGVEIQRARIHTSA